MEKLTDQTLNKFLEITASDAPVPGGGSISALNGAIAASLATMVARLTLGRKKYADVEPQMNEIIGRLTPLAAQLGDLVDEDSKAYAFVMDAYRLPKETDDEKKARHDAIQGATMGAALVPLKVAETVCSVLPMIVEVADKGNTNAVTDAGVAALCARAAIKGALLNVSINLGGIDDKAFVTEMEKQIAALDDAADNYEQHILEIVKSKI